MNKNSQSNTIKESIKKRNPSWKDLKKIVEFKTFYLVITLGLIGIIFILLNSILFSPTSHSPWKGVLTALGVTFLTSSTISILYEVFLRLDIIDFIAEKIVKTLPLEIGGSTGIIRFGPDRTELDFQSLWQSAAGSFKIIGFCANDILSPSNTPLLVRKFKEHEEFYMQILIINPWSTMANRRSEAEAYQTQQEFLRRVWAILLETQDIIQQLLEEGIDKTRFDVKVYDAIPSVSMIIDDQKAIVTPIICTTPGGSSPFFELQETNAANCVYSKYKKHFDSIWQNATSIISNDLDFLYSKTLKEDIDRTKNLPSSLSDWLTLNLGGNKEVTS